MRSRDSRTALRAFVVTLGLSLLNSCVSAEVDRRFRNEYRCRDFRREDLGARAFRFTGCGHSVTYVCVGGGRDSVVCSRQAGSDGVVPAPVRAQERRLQARAVVTDGAQSLRLDLAGAGLHLAYTPQRDRDTVMVVSEGAACADLIVLTSRGRYGDGQGIPLLEFVNLPNDERVELVACRWRALLSEAELRVLRLFIRHALDMHREQGG